MNICDHVTIERPRPTDEGRIYEILATANFDSVGGTEMPAYPLEDCFVARAEGRIVGVAGYQVLDAETAKTTVITICPEWRGSGVGSIGEQLIEISDRQIVIPLLGVKHAPIPQGLQPDVVIGAGYPQRNAHRLGTGNADQPGLHYSFRSIVIGQRQIKHLTSTLSILASFHGDFIPETADDQVMVSPNVPPDSGGHQQHHPQRQQEDDQATGVPQQ